MERGVLTQKDENRTQRQAKTAVDETNKCLDLVYLIQHTNSASGVRFHTGPASLTTEELSHRELVLDTLAMHLASRTLLSGYTCFVITEQ